MVIISKIGAHNNFLFIWGPKVEKFLKELMYIP